MFLDAGPGGGSFPWWVFLMMPLMMLGMGLMMWLMIRMMMGMGGHGASPEPADAPPKPASDDASEGELASLRREAEALRSRLAAMERQPTMGGHGDDAPALASREPKGSGGDEPEPHNV